MTLQLSHMAGITTELYALITACLYLCYRFRKNLLKQYVCNKIRPPCRAAFKAVFAEVIVKTDEALITPSLEIVAQTRVARDACETDE